MKRFHVHVAVNDLAKSVRFYSSIFGAEPTVLRDDYAKWMLDDPRINFAISNPGHEAGLDHLGFQDEGDDELKAMRARLEAADARLIEQAGQACCYARSEKYWVTDAQGIAWEAFRTLASIPVFGEAPAIGSKESACCIPIGTDKAAKVPCC
jgi:catechol 2,3-dioxygenase-like lactoylglutathione lyase family enzyme